MDGTARSGAVTGAAARARAVHAVLATSARGGEAAGQSAAADDRARGARERTHSPSGVSSRE